MKRAGQIHRENCQPYCDGRGPGAWPGQLEYRKPYQRRQHVPTDQRPWLRRLGIRRSDDERDGGRKRDDGQRIVRCEREPLHGADGNRNPKAGNGPLRRAAWTDSDAGSLCGLAPVEGHSNSTSKKHRGGRSLCRPRLAVSRESLLQIGHRRQVSRKLDDTRRAAPVRTVPERIVPGNGGGSDLSIESTREDAAITLRQVGVRVAQVEREHLVGEADTDVPGVVISIMDAIRE